MPVEIFIAYSRKDTTLLDEFRVHLKPLERAGKAHIWYDGKIEPGAVWEEAIKEHLHRSDIILLLVSADAIASDYFYDKEVTGALERHRLGHARVVPMIMRPCAWNATPLAELQALPKNGKPLTTWPDRDEAFADATNSLLAMVNNIEQLKQEQVEQARLQKEAEENERLDNERRLHEAAEQKQRAEQERQQREAEARLAAVARRNTYLETVARARELQQAARWTEARSAWQQALDLHAPEFPESRSALQGYIAECDAELARQEEQKRKEKEARERKQKEAAERKKRETAAADKKDKEAEAARPREAEAALQKKKAAMAEQRRKEAEAAKRQRQERLGRQLRITGMAAGIVLAIFIVYKLASGGDKTPEIGANKTPENSTKLTPLVRKPALTPLQKLEADMALITGGAFTMGCKTGRDTECSDDEKPAHEVRVRDFSIGRYEVTQAQWRAVMGSDPPKLYNKGCDQCPVERVSWNDIQVFLNKLNTLTGKRYRLPTEAEWEYAARGGNQSKGYLYSGSNTIGDVAWYDANAKSGNTDGAQKTTRPVGTKKPNELGLYDMSGNVWEWCEDDWHDNYNGAPTDGSAWVDSPRGGVRVLRGGSWFFASVVCRAANRYWYNSSVRYNVIGFRLARD